MKSFSSHIDETKMMALLRINKDRKLRILFLIMGLYYIIVGSSIIRDPSAKLDFFDAIHFIVFLTSMTLYLAE